MNDDVLEMLRRADPARDSGDYDDTRIDRQISLIVRAHAGTAQQAPSPRRSTRHWGVPAVAFLAVAGAGLATAAAAGWLSPQARQAFDSPDARQSLRQLYGSTADLDRARERVTAPGPDGSTISTWTVPVADKGPCTAILVSKKSARLPGGGQRSDLPLECEAVPQARQVQRSARFSALEWRSRDSGVDYAIYSGPLGPAARVQLRLADGSRLPATSHDGYFLLPAVPVAKITCAALVGFDPLGHQVGLAGYLTSGCPGDPYHPGPVAPTPAPGSTIIENEPSQAVGYSAGVDVGVDAVIKQDPRRGAGSSVPGMSLVTVRLQFYTQPPGQQPALPTSVSFDLLYGQNHEPAATDAGKHNDPDLSGDWTPPHPDSTTWLPQLSYDVPTDQLTKLQVRINGDASHPTIVFGSVRVTE